MGEEVGDYWLLFAGFCWTVCHLGFVLQVYGEGREAASMVGICMWCFIGFMYTQQYVIQVLHLETALRESRYNNYDGGVANGRFHLSPQLKRAIAVAAQFVLVLSPFAIIYTYATPPGERPLWPVLTVPLQGVALIFGVKYFKLFYGLLVAHVAGVLVVATFSAPHPSRPASTVDYWLVCSMSAIILIVCSLCRLHSGYRPTAVLYNSRV